MKIGVVGCGALGSFYGAKLCHGGHDVHFLLRSDFDTVRRQGVRIESPEGNLHVRPCCAREPESIGACDLVLIGLKTTANPELRRLVPPLAGPGTAVMTLQNGLGNESALAAILDPARIFGGLCFVCLNRVQPGVIRHLAQGLVVMGAYQRAPDAETHDIASAFVSSGIPCKVATNLERAHWEKLVWNIPFNGLGVASSAGLDAVLSGDIPPGHRPGPCLTTDLLLADPRWESCVRELMLEVIGTANALGLGVSEHLAEVQIERTRATTPYAASTLVDFEQGRALELESMFLNPLREAQKAGVATPRLQSLCRVLQQLDPAKALTAGSAAAAEQLGGP